MFCKKSHVQSASALLADAARYPSRHHSFLHWYHLLPLGRPIVSGSKLDSLLFTFPPIEDERFATFQVGAMRIDVLWTVPLSSSERQFADENGIGELEAALEEHGAAVSDFFRDPVA
jgi:hypothetical protein